MYSVGSHNVRDVMYSVGSHSVMDVMYSVGSHSVGDVMHSVGSHSVRGDDLLPNKDDLWVVSRLDDVKLSVLVASFVHLDFSPV